MNVRTGLEERRIYAEFDISRSFTTSCNQFIGMTQLAEVEVTPDFGLEVSIRKKIFDENYFHLFLAVVCCNVSSYLADQPLRDLMIDRLETTGTR